MLNHPSSRHLLLLSQFLIATLTFASPFPSWCVVAAKLKRKKKWINQANPMEVDKTKRRFFGLIGTYVDPQSLIKSKGGFETFASGI